MLPVRNFHLTKSGIVKPEPQEVETFGWSQSAFVKFRLRLQADSGIHILIFIYPESSMLNQIFIAKLTNLPKCI